MHRWPRRWCCQRSKSPLALQLGFDLLVPESLLCPARSVHRRERHRPLVSRFGVLLRLSSGSLDSLLTRVIHDHASRSHLDLTLRIRHVVSRRRLEDLNLASRCPLHRAKSIPARLRIPQHRSLTASTTMLDTIKEPSLLLSTQSKNLRHKSSLLRTLRFLQPHHSLLQPFLGSQLVLSFLFTHLPVDFPPVLGIFGVEHFVLGVGDIAFDEFLPERSGALGDVWAGDFDLAELGGVVDTAEDGLDGVVGEVGDVGYAGDVFDCGVLGHG
jgi:hypothetical protein